MQPPKTIPQRNSTAPPAVVVPDPEEIYLPANFYRADSSLVLILP